MADLGNQLEGASSGLERLTDGFDNLVIKLSGVSALEARIIKEKQAINKQLSKIDKDKIREEKKALPLQKKMTIQLQQRLKNTTLLNKGLKETIKGMKLFEKSMGGLKSGIGNMGKGIAKMGAAVGKAGIIGGLVIGVKFLIDGLLKVDNAMAGLVKRTKLTRQELAGVREAALAAEQSISIMGPEFEQITAEAGNLVETFGRASMVTDKLIKDSLALQQGYGVAAGEAGKLTEALERSARSGAEFRQSILDIAGKAGVSASLVMRDMASRSQQIAIQNERSTEAMAKMVATSLKIGVSLKDFEGVKTAFSDIGNIANTLGDATAIFGQEFADIMGSHEELHALNLKGETGRLEIMRRYEKAMKAVTTEMEDGTIWVDKMGAPYSELEGYMENIARGMGATNEAQKQLSRTVKPLSAEERKRADEAERLEKIYKDQLGVLEYFQKIVTGVFGKITTSFSEALGLDSSEGGVRGLLDQLSKDIEGVFSFNTLRADVAKGGGGFDGWVSAMMTRLTPLFEYVQDKMMLALEKAFDWIGENVNFNASALIPGVGGPLFTTKEGEAREKLANIRDYDYTSQEGGPDYRSAASYTAYADMGFEDAEAQNWAAKQLEAGVDLDKVTARAYRKSIADTKWVKEQITGDPSLAKGIFGLPPGKKRALIEAQLATRAQAAYEADMKKKAEAEAAAAKPAALGRIGGGLSLVGEEGRGEVVISRSALRSGIGVGGRAASALAGIGVPGFREGYASADLSGVHGRQGLMGAQGSQSFRSARGDAFQAEQARQQAAMMEYWRNHYEKKMDDMVDEKAKPKEPPWLAKFFLKHNQIIGKELQKNAGPTMTAAIMTGMTKWSQGGSLKEAMELGAKAGITAGINDPNSKLNQLLEKTGNLGNVLKAGMATWAAGGSGEDIKRAVVATGARTLATLVRDRGKKKKEPLKISDPPKINPDDALGGGPLENVPMAPGSGPMTGPAFAATGKYVNSPTLMMVGEEGRGEVVVPTERIRKGLPINKGVANELASIGVPGFEEGGTPDPKSFKGQGGWGESMAQGLEGFASVYEQTGDWKQAASAGVGGGIGAAAGMGLTAMGVPPPLSTMIGGVVGNLATKGINHIFKITGGYGDGRDKSLKLIEDHIKTGGRFDFGAPSGLSKAMGQAVGGYERTPTKANFDKTVEKLASSRLVASMNVPAPALIALAQGQTGGNQAIKMYDSINRNLYGNTPDRYRKALQMPALATGGVVTKPTTALIGEGGPEAVVPLGNSEMMQELRKQNKLMAEMIKTQKETSQTEIRLDGRVVSEVVGQNFYDIGNGM